MSVCSLLVAAGSFALGLIPLLAESAFTVPTLPVAWSAGGLSAGYDSAGQAARIAADPSGNIAVVSAPSLARDMPVTSYTAGGVFRWRNAVTPTSGVFVGDWVAAAANGDFVAVGHNISASSGNPIAITLVRFGADGALQWRVNLARTLPGVGRLLVDAGGNAYLAFNSVGDGQDIQVHKYSPTGDLLWSQVINTGLFSNNIATSLALSPDEADLVATGNTTGGAEWITALYDTGTGARRWLAVSSEGTAALDAVVDADRVYVTGRGNVGINTFLTVVAYERASGARLWRTDKVATGSSGAAGLRISKAPDGSLVVAGHASFGFLDWYVVALETTGTVRWEAVRDGGLNTNEIPVAVLSLPDGTAVVTGPGGPNLPGGYIGGVTAGYSSAGTPLWEAFSPLATTWAAALPDGKVCATGGYDAYVRCWQVPVMPGPPQPSSVVSRKTHGAAGDFDVDLPLTGTPGLECRSGGAVTGDHKVVFTFSSAITLGSATVTPEAGRSAAISGTPALSPDGRIVTLQLTNVSDAQTVAIMLSGVGNGNGTNEITVRMSLLAGDVNGDAIVNAGDILQIRTRAGQGNDATNFRSDVNSDGVINSGDVLIVRSHSGTFLP